MPAPTPPRCVCTLSDKTPLTDRAGWFEYTYRCHWEPGMGGGSYIDRTTYTVSVESQTDADALKQAVDQCPYEPKPDR